MKGKMWADVRLPEETAYLVLDADAVPESTVDVFINDIHNTSYIVPDFEDLSVAGDNPGWAAAATAKNAPHGRIFRQLLIRVEGLEASKEPVTLRLRCQGDLKICRWRFVKGNTK